MNTPGLRIAGDQEVKTSGIQRSMSSASMFKIDVGVNSRGSYHQPSPETAGFLRPALASNNIVQGFYMNQSGVPNRMAEQINSQIQTAASKPIPGEFRREFVKRDNFGQNSQKTSYQGNPLLRSLNFRVGSNAFSSGNSH